MTDKRYILIIHADSNRVYADDTSNRMFNRPNKNDIVLGFDNQKVMAEKASELLSQGSILHTRGGSSQLKIFKAAFK